MPTEEHRAIKLLREYDEMKSKLWTLEQELNRACSEYGREYLKVWGFAPSHLRQRLHALEQANVKHLT